MWRSEGAGETAEGLDKFQGVARSYWILRQNTGGRAGSDCPLARTSYALFWFRMERMIRDLVSSNRSGTILFGICREVTVVRLIFRFYTFRPLDAPACPRPLPMAGNLTAIFPLEDLSFPGLADVSYVKLLTALVAFPAAVVILHVFSQLVCALRPTPLGGFYLTRRLLVPASRQESPSNRFPLDTHRRLRYRVWNGPYGVL